MNQVVLRRAAAWGARNGPDWFVRWAPPIIGFIAFLVARSARRAVLLNLRRIHGSRELWLDLRDAVATFIAFSQNLTESLCPDRFLPERRLIIRGRARSDSILESTGVILVTAHVGPWDSAAMAFPQLSERPVLMLMAGEGDAEAAQVQDDVRVRQRVRVARLGRSPLDALVAVEHLAQRGVLVAQLDRPFGARPPVVTSLFGEPFFISPGLIRLSGMTGCPLLPVFMARLDHGGHLVQVGDPISVQPRADSSQIQVAAQRFALQLQAHLSDFPTQWFHFVVPSSDR